mgnify:CR=1 FL=1
MRNKMIIQAAMIMAALVLLLAACGDAASEAPAEVKAEGMELSTLDEKGLETLLAENKGKPVLLSFWASWCPPCREEMPMLSQLAKEYEGRLTIIAASLDEQKGDVRQFFKKGDPGFDVYMGSPALADKFQVTGIPHTVIFDKDGAVAMSQAGLFPHEMLTMLIDKILER